MIRYASCCSGVESASLAWEPLGWKPVWFSEVEPFPCKVLAERFGASSPVNPLDPEDASDDKDRKERANWLKAIRREKMPTVADAKVPNLGDMSKINGKDYHGAIDLMVGGTPCFVAGTMVLTPSGYRAIETLKIGDEIVTHTGDVRKITATGNKDAATGEAKILGRPPIRCTGNHPFYSIATKLDNRRESNTYGQRIQDGEYEFKAVEDSVGRYAGRIKAKRFDTHIPCVYRATQNDVMELAGWYLGDGYIRRWTEKSKKAVIIAAVCERKIQQFIERFNGVIQYSIGTRDGKITITNTVLADWLIENFGEKSQSKRLPYWIYTSKMKTSLIAGYEKTDGSHRANGNVRITTTSPALAYGMADLYENASVEFGKRKPKHLILGRTVSQSDTYTINKAKGKTPKTQMRCGRYASIIRGWKNDGAIRTVYNITVDGEHSYIANGIAVHNCQGFSIAGTQKGLDDPRSALALKYVELLGSARPRWFVWENVPNAFSCNGGGDVKEFFRQITEIGYGVCWRVLDAEYVRVDGFPGAVPQRRRRVFAVGYLGDWRPAAKVLFESKVLCGSSAPRRIKGQESSGDTKTCDRQSDALDDGAGTDTEIRNAVETEKGFYRESDVGGTLEAHEDQHRRNIVLYDNQTRAREPKECGEVSCTLQSIMGTGGNNQPVLCIENGQSAAASAPAVDKSTTISCDHEAPIIVFHGSQDPISNRDHANAVNRNQGLENCIAISQYGDVAGSLTARHDSSPCADRGMNIIACNTKKQAMNCDDGVIGCLSATDYKEPQIICYENHGQDSRVKECGDVAPTVSAKAGTGGNNLPLVAFGIDPLASNSMKSKNPNSGFHEIEVAKTLDTSEQNPCKNQGGMVVLSIAENVIDRTANSGANGVGVKENVSYTLNTAGTPGVCVPLDMRNATRDPSKRDESNRQGVGIGEDGDPMNTLSTVQVPGVAYQKTEFRNDESVKDGTILLKNIGWIVRRITPLEAERLMGFPDYHTRIPWNGKSAEDCPDAPRYKACGNSMCVNAMRWIGTRIDAVDKSIQNGTFEQLFNAEDLELEGDEPEMDEEAEAEYMVILENQAKEIIRLQRENEELRQTVAEYQKKEQSC